VRGTAAGEAVVSQANTAGFESGYERAFGDRPVERGRWIYVEGRGLVPAEEYSEPLGDGRVMVVGDSHYEGAVAPDGTPIDTRRRHREYLKRTGLALAGDFSDDFRQRTKSSEDRAEAKEIRETVGRTWHELEKRR
jgi:hypothetical protein